MFGLFKPRMAPEGPVEIEMDCAIARAASDVYPMVDFADPNHHKRAVGTITRTGDTTFELVVDMAPGLVFPITELEAAPPRVNTIESVLPPELGAPLIKTVERTKDRTVGRGQLHGDRKNHGLFPSHEREAIRSRTSAHRHRLQQFADEAEGARGAGRRCRAGNRSAPERLTSFRCAIAPRWPPARRLPGPHRANPWRNTDPRWRPPARPRCRSATGGC